MNSPSRQAAFAAVALTALLLAACSGTPGDSGSGGHLSTARPTSTTTATRTPATTPIPTAQPSNAPLPGVTPEEPDPATGSAAGSGGQSKSDACAIMNDVVNRASDLNGSDPGSDGFGDDPAATVAAIDALARQFGSAADQVSNTEIKPAAKAVAQSAGTYFSSVGAYASDPGSIDPTALSNQVAEFGTQLSNLQTLCGG